MNEYNYNLVEDYNFVTVQLQLTSFFTIKRKGERDMSETDVCFIQHQKTEANKELITSSRPERVISFCLCMYVSRVCVCV